MKNQNTKIIIGLLIVSICFNVYQFMASVDIDNILGKQESNMPSMHKMPDGSVMSNGGGMQMNNSNSINSMMMDMNASMRGKSGAELEKVFLQEMIVHHQGAVDMAKLLLQDKNIKTEIVDFANKIIAAQNQEIEQMKSWLRGY